MVENQAPPKKTEEGGPNKKERAGAMDDLVCHLRVWVIVLYSHHVPVYILTQSSGSGVHCIIFPGHAALIYTFLFLWCFFF